MCGEIGRTRVLGLLTLLTGLHLAAALLVFQPFSAFVSAAAIDSFDYCVLEYQLHLARETFAASGRLWGYDPFLLAGYVQTFIWNSNVFLQVLAVLLPWLPVGMVLKLATVLAAAALPWLLYLGWRGFGARRAVALVGVLAGLAWFRLSEGNMFWAIAMTTGYLVFPGSFAALGLLAALLRGERRGYWLLAAVPLLMLVHKTMVVAFGLPALVLLLAARGEWNKRLFLWLAATGGLTLLLNAFWIVPVWRYRHFAAFDPAISYWSNLDPLAWLRDLIDPRAKIGIFNRPLCWGDMFFRDLTLLGLMAAVWRRRHLPKQAAGYYGALLVLALFIYGGSFLSFLRPLDPSRYVSHLYLLMTVPAVLVLVGRNSRIRYSRIWTAAGAIVIVAVGLGLLPSSSRHFLELGIETRPARELGVMADWINGLPGRGRVHVETFSSFIRREAFPWNEMYARIAVKLPTQTKRLLLGGHYSGFFVTYNDVNFYSGEWRGIPLGQWPPEKLAEMLKRYHVEYLLTWSQEAATALAARPGVVEPLAAPAPFRGWKVKDPGDYFLEGSGVVEAWNYDYLELLNVQPENGRAVLSFHWGPTLRCEGARIVPVPTTFDPAPFIGLENPGSHIVITNGGAW